MSPNIRIDKDVYDFLKLHAEPFQDTPNSVLRRLLKIPATTVGKNENSPTLVASKRVTRPAHRRPQRSRKRKSTPRAAPGSILPEHEYVAPVLASINERGGSATAREVIEDVGRALNGKLTEKDQAKLSSGGIRWHNRVQFVRLKLTEEGLLAKNSPRGVWQLTEAGARAAKGRNSGRND
jgi:Mrr N-terminal domain